MKSEPGALSLNGYDLFIPLADCRLYAPVRGSKIIGIGRNYPNYTKNEGKHSGPVPAGFIKVPSCIVGPGRDILKPQATRQLDCETELAVVEQALDAIVMGVPNMTLSDVPAGDETNNVVIRSWGTPRAPAGVKPHWDIAAAQGLFDLERGAKVSGSGFVVYRGKGARLVRALMNLDEFVTRN